MKIKIILTKEELIETWKSCNKEHKDSIIEIEETPNIAGSFKVADNTAYSSPLISNTLPKKSGNYACNKNKNWGKNEKYKLNFYSSFEDCDPLPEKIINIITYDTKRNTYM